MVQDAQLVLLLLTVGRDLWEKVDTHSRLCSKMMGGVLRDERKDGNCHAPYGHETNDTNNLNIKDLRSCQERGGPALLNNDEKDTDENEKIISSLPTPQYHRCPQIYQLCSILSTSTLN